MDQQTSSWLGSMTAAGTIIGTFLGYVPALGALVALIYYVIQISESATAQRWLANRRARKIARLKAKVLMMEAQSRPPLPGPGD